MIRLLSTLLIGGLSVVATGCGSDSVPTQTQTPAIADDASKSMPAPRQPAPRQPVPQTESSSTTVDADTSTPPTIKTIMDVMVNPSGEFLFQSIADIADEHGITHKAPKTAADWAAVRHHLKVLMEAPGLLAVPGLKAANPGTRSRNPSRENQPEQVQRLLDAQHSDFARRAQRLGQAAAVGMKAADAQDKDALFAAITEIDKACESCHLHYWYPNDVRAHQAAKEEGGIIE